jgi:hypothetical protein
MNFEQEQDQQQQQALSQRPPGRICKHANISLYYCRLTHSRSVSTASAGYKGIAESVPWSDGGRLAMTLAVKHGSSGVVIRTFDRTR